MTAATQSAARSLRSDVEAHVTFVSRTNRRTAIHWLDYAGRRVEYCQLNYFEQYTIETFETHPWVFVDVMTGDQLVTHRGDAVYFPQPWNGDPPDIVYLGIPVYSLRERCLQVVRNSMSNEEIQSTDIPDSLKRDILIIPDFAPHTIYVPPDD